MKAADTSSNPLLIVQGGELNRHLGSSTPMSAEKRWGLVKFLLPAFFLTFVIISEPIIARVWAGGERLSDHLPKVLGAPIALTAFVFLVMALEFRILRKTKRKMKLDNKGFFLNGNKIGRIKWDRLLSWTLEPVPSEPGLEKLTLRHTWDKKGRRKRSWSLVLTQPEQTDALNAYIGRLKETGVTVPALVTQTAPTPRKVITPKISSLDSWIAVVSCLLLINGIYLLAGAYSISDDHSPLSSIRVHTHAVLNELDRFVIRHFSSPEEFRRFLLFTGGGLILAGGFLLIFLMFDRKKNTVADAGKVPVAP